MTTEFGEKLKSYSAGKVLDFGTGAGASAKNIINAVRDFDSIVGIDVSTPEQEISQDLLNNPKFKYIQYNSLPLPFESSYFDTVCMANTLHHLQPLKRTETVQELIRVLKPGGCFLFIEGYRDLQNGARKTQIYAHLLRAQMDFDNGMPHYATLLRKELLEFLEELDFEGTEIFDFAPEQQDFKEKENLDNIAQFLRAEINKHSHLPRFKQYQCIGNMLEKRIYRTGYLGSIMLLAVCYKQKMG